MLPNLLRNQAGVKWPLNIDLTINLAEVSSIRTNTGRKSVNPNQDLELSADGCSSCSAAVFGAAVN